MTEIGKHKLVLRVICVKIQSATLGTKFFALHEELDLLMFASVANMK